MKMFRRGRFLFWAARELSKKYTKSLVLGIVLGFGITILLWNLFPNIKSINLVPIQRIGYIGEYTPSSLPIDIQQKISYGLTTIADDGSVLPGLATSWEATDSGKKYTFHLKSDVVWQNGKNVVAKDVNYNIRSVTFSAPDTHTIIASLQSPFSPFLTLIAKPIFSNNLNGFGAYKISTLLLKGDKIRFLRLVGAHDTSLPTIEYRFYKSDIQAITAYKLGEVDQITDIASIDPSLYQWKNTNIVGQEKTDRIVSLFFNLHDTLIADKTVRQALAYAVPPIQGSRAYTPINKTSWAYTDTVKHYDFDMTQAKKLFTDSKIGTSSGTLTIHTFSQYLTLAQQIAKNWNDLGVKTDIRVENVVPDHYQVLLSAQDVPTDPDQYSYWHSTQSNTNITGYVNVKVDKLLEDARTEPDQTTRKKLYVDFQKRLVEDLPVLFLYYPTTYTITRIR